MSGRKEEYVQARSDLLERITRALQSDERFVAAWLAGSFGRGEQTWLSDLDLHVVVSEQFSASLCAAPWQIGARTAAERMALFQQFGTPGLIFERQSSANQIGGILTNVVYQESAQSVDWTLLPQSKAYREHPCLLLFDKVGLPEPPTAASESLEQRIERVSTQVGFFWIIACGCARALAAGKLSLFYSSLLEMERALGEVKAALCGERAPYLKSTNQPLYSTAEQCAVILRALCDDMEGVMPQVVHLGGYVPASPRSLVEMRLALVEP